MKYNLLIQQKTILYSLSLLVITSGMTNQLLSQINPEKGLFESDEVIQITLSGNVRDALNDRSGKPKKHIASLSYYQNNNSEIIIPVELQTRGNFRRMKENCTYPPLWVYFPKDSSYLSSLFGKQKKTKLVMPCRDEEYIIREWLVYKLYNLFSPLSFQARLVKVKVEDPKIKKLPEPFYAMLLEEEKQMARRNNLMPIETGLKPNQTQAEAFLTMAVFEYLIGNTDWSVQFLHNVKLLAKETNAIPITVPYDFDHAGIVDAPYAHPAEELQMRSIQERRYRGYCVPDLKAFDSVIARFNSLKNEVSNIYKECKLLDEKYLKFVLNFIDDFYKTINDPKSWHRDFKYPCDPNGTGNFVIKGLKENN